jgi:hypothetical protein
MSNTTNTVNTTTSNMSRSYFSNTSKHTAGGSSSHHSHEHQVPPARIDVPGPSNFCDNIPDWPINAQRSTFGQQMPQHPTQQPGLNHPGNQPMYGGGYGSPPQQIYHASGYPGPPSYLPAGGFTPPANHPSRSWGNPNPYYPNLLWTGAMDVNDPPSHAHCMMAPLPRRRNSPPCQGPQHEHMTAAHQPWDNYPHYPKPYEELSGSMDSSQDGG